MTQIPFWTVTCSKWITVENLLLLSGCGKMVKGGKNRDPARNLAWLTFTPFLLYKFGSITQKTGGQPCRFFSLYTPIKDQLLIPDSSLIQLAQLSHYGFIICLLIAAALSLFPERKGSLIFLIAAVCLCLPFFGIRAWLKQFFPFTDKTESFVTLALMISVCAGWYYRKLTRQEFSILILMSALWSTTALVFKTEIRFPTPYLRTIWYPLHVPLSFASYALWFIAGIGSLPRRRPTPARLSDLDAAAFRSTLCRNGFIFFTLSMIFGGIWGYLAWGAYFLWDPKVVWSVIVWFFYGNLLHLDKLPRFKKWKDPLFILGILIILITFVGTGFFTRSIHRF